jgi:hypothetical protein
MPVVTSDFGPAQWPERRLCIAMWNAADGPGSNPMQGRVGSLKQSAHDPPKCERFGEKIMLFSINLERDQTQNRFPLLLIALGVGKVV